MCENHFQQFLNTAFLLNFLTVLIPADNANAQMGWGYPSTGTSSSNNWDSGWESSGWLGSSGVDRGWQLGVTADNTDAGVVVRQVTPNSPAARANIISGDVIVCVAGDQVGRVGSQIFDLGEQINRHADSAGRVPMLVYYRRNGQLSPLQVQLNDQRGGLSGTITLQGGSLPQNSVVTVQLENVSKPYYLVRNGQYSFRLSSFNLGDIPFELNYDPKYISTNDLYRVRAYITSGGATIYDTPQPPYVLTKGYPNSVRLALRPSTYSPGSGGGSVSTGYRPTDSYLEQITSAYRRYLGRPPSALELAAWFNTPDLARRVQRLPIELMATQEFYDRMGANDYAWLQRAFTEVVGKAPSSYETNLWMTRFAELRYSRTELLNQLQMQVGR